MAKTLSVYLNDSEMEMLQTLKVVMDIPEESRVLKAALRHLGNDHGSGEHNGELRVEIPISMRLTGLIREAINEEKKEKANREAMLHVFREIEEKGKEMAHGLMEEWKK